MNEDALDLRIACRAHQQPGMGRGPDPVIDIERVFLEHRSRRQVLPFGCGEFAVRHRREPDIGIKSNLMRGMAREHRAAARLGYVADKEAGPAILGSRLA